MLKEGLEDFDNSQVIIGITEGEEIESLDYLRRVSHDDFSLSAKTLLLEYCKAAIGYEETWNFLMKHRDDQKLDWARDVFSQKIKWAFEPDEQARKLIDAINSGNFTAMRQAVQDGGCIMTTDMLLATIPYADLSDDTLDYLFSNAMSLKVRCLSVLTLVKEVPDDSKSKLYDALCNMISCLVNLLIDNQGLVQ